MAASKFDAFWLSSNALLHKAKNLQHRSSLIDSGHRVHNRRHYQVASFNSVFPDINEKHTLYLENSVLNDWPDYTDPKADVTVRLGRPTLNKMVERTAKGITDRVMRRFSDTAPSSIGGSTLFCPCGG